MIGVFVQVNGDSAKATACPLGYVIQEDGCWEWVGAIQSKGYGKWSGRGAHRVMYERNIGPVPPGLQLDHLCRNRKCVNPAHLEAVTPQQNVLRGNSPALTRVRWTRFSASDKAAAVARAIAGESMASIALSIGAATGTVSRWALATSFARRKSRHT